MTEPPQPITPPRQPGPTNAPPQAAVWPTVLGIIAIVVGAGGILGGVMTIASPFFTELMSKTMPPGQPTGVEALKEWSTWHATSGCVAILVATLLVVGGIGLDRRRAGAVAICRVFAVVKILFVAANSVLGYAVMQEQFEEIGRQGMPPGTGGFLGIGAVVGVAFGLLWGWALPVFFLIWFSRPSVKDTIAGWGPRIGNDSESSADG